MTSPPLSNYDVIPDFDLIVTTNSPYIFIFYRNFFILNQIKLKFGADMSTWMLFLIFGSEAGFYNDFRQYDPKTILSGHFRPFFCKKLARVIVTMTSVKVSAVQKGPETVYNYKSIANDQVSAPCPLLFLSCHEKTT